MSAIKSYRDESAVDICIRGYNHLEGLISVCRDNGIACDFEETTEQQRLIDDALKAELANNRPLFTVKPVPKSEEVIVSKGQNLVDLALQETGSVEGLLSVLRNNNYAPDDDAVPGTVLKTMTVDVVDDKVKTFYRSLSYVVNTGDSSTEEPITGGIGVMIIEDTFIVG